MCRFLQREWPQQDEPDLSSLVDSFDSFFTRREVEPDQRPQQDEPDLSSLVDSFDSFFTRREVEPDQPLQQMSQISHSTRIEQCLEKLAKEYQEYKESQMKLMAQLAQLAEDNLIDLDDYHRLLELQKSS